MYTNWLKQTWQDFLEILFTTKNLKKCLVLFVRIDNVGMERRISLTRKEMKVGRYWDSVSIYVAADRYQCSELLKHDSTGAQTALAQGDAQWLIMKERFYIVTASLDITEGLSMVTGHWSVSHWEDWPLHSPPPLYWHHINSINTNSKLNNLDKVGPAFGTKYSRTKTPSLSLLIIAIFQWCLKQ